MTGKADSGWMRQLRERGVIRVAASYAVIAWLLLQIADVTFEPLGVPRWVMVSLIVAALLGFPVAVALAWFYEAGDQGIARDTAAVGIPRPVVHGLRRYADVAIIGLLLVAVAVLLVRQSDLAGPGSASPAIAVLPFQNLSTAAEGEVLALGIAESVLHQLANLPKLEVISRTSSFAFGNKQQDAREIGKQLGARFLLEGSVQSDRARMRVTTQLIDTQTGADVWSMRFDRAPGDIFEVQDEIALQVTRALELSLDAKERDRLTGQGTENLDAYLAFLQGRSLQANDRVVDTRDAIGHFERATRLDPEFANAYVSLADAKLFVAEYEVTDDRAERFEAALREGRELVAARACHRSRERRRVSAARAPDRIRRPVRGRGRLSEGPRAESELCGGLCGPRGGAVCGSHTARGGAADARTCPPDRSTGAGLRRFQGRLPLVRAQRRQRRGQAAEQRTRAPSAVPAGAACGNVRFVPSCVAARPTGSGSASRRSRSTRWSNRRGACSSGPISTSRIQWRRNSSQTPRAAMKLSPGPSWHCTGGTGLAAGEAAYEALERGTASPDNTGLIYAAIRLHARTTGDAARAIAAIEPHARVEWDGNGKPTFRDGRGDGAIALADLLILDGQIERGRRLLAEIIGTMEREIARGST